jgi:UDP-glucose 4-epimerase
LFAVADRQYSVWEIAQAIVKNIGGRVKMVEWPMDREVIDIGDAVISNEKIRTILNWAPRHDLDEGLVKTAEYFRPCLSKYL